ncbi:MAG: aldehyde dehydrogenase (NADP(+)) [Planctomycetota bacterium]|nr:MAG: aldehyde dehydrogenase (NADP(+)) [Planctomycetota bacterium]
MSVQPVLISGQWLPSAGQETFQAVDPSTKQPLALRFPISPWAEIEAVIRHASEAAAIVRSWPGERFASFLEDYACRIETHAADLIAIAHRETGLPVEPRLKTAELPRTVNQLRQAAACARDGSWATATIDTKSNIRAQFGPIGPVVVFGPNNFPYAYNGIAGGDFASAVAAGNPVIAKGHSSHPGTTLRLAQLCHEAAQATGMPAGFVQLIYRTSHADGYKLVSHPLIGASGYTGARSTGLSLKDAADKGGKPFYCELSSVNPVFVLPGALQERLPAVVDEFVGSCLMGAGQFCTNPGLVVVSEGASSEQFISAVAARFDAAPVGTMLSGGVESNFRAGLVALQQAGATVVCGNKPADHHRYCYANTLLRVSGEDYLKKPHGLQSEAFGNASLVVVARDLAQMIAIAKTLEGNLTGGLYTDTQGSDDAAYHDLAPWIREKVGRLLNDKMPTGVAVVSSMNHGGPFPATGHPGFTAVGFPGSIHRFAMLQSYDNVRVHRLPPALRDKNPTGKQWRLIDGNWSQADVP